MTRVQEYIFLILVKRNLGDIIKVTGYVCQIENFQKEIDFLMWNHDAWCLIPSHIG